MMALNVALGRICLDVLSGSGGARQLFDKAIRLMRGICFFTGILAITGGLLFVCWLLMWQQSIRIPSRSYCYGSPFTPASRP